MLTLIIIMALLATMTTLGLGLLSMGLGGSLDKSYGERFMWARVTLQATTLALLLGTLIVSNT